MLFHSYWYIGLFLPVSVLLFFGLCQRHRYRESTLFLITASLFFYSWWNEKYLALILFSIGFNYLSGRWLSGSLSRFSLRKRRWTLTAAISVNVALLVFFKYTDFIISIFNTAADMNISLLQLALPLAISFFTFQQIAFLVDCYKGNTRVGRLSEYALFVSFFPQLIAGPIVHHKEMVAQFLSRRKKQLDWENVYAGLFLLSVGLFKKVFVADMLALWVDNGYGNVSVLSPFEAWLVSACFSMQIYYDFSGYTDMALGSARIFNIHLPVNFNSPYKAVSIRDFWRRWHITLSRWLRNYVYIPLGGNRTGQYRSGINVMITFLIGGIWHGAGWTFLLWGACHGFANTVCRFAGSRIKLPKAAGWAVTMLFLNVTWVLFRSPDINTAFTMVASMFNMNRLLSQITLGTQFNTAHILLPHQAYSMFAFILLSVSSLIFFKNSNELSSRMKPDLFRTIIIIILLILGLPMFDQPNEFIYFDF